MPCFSGCCRNVSVALMIYALVLTFSWEKQLQSRKRKNDYDFEVGISDSLASLKSSIRPARLNAATGIRVEPKALTSITARHSVAGAITYPNGRWKRGKSLMGRDTAQQLRGRPVRRQNKSTLSLWFCPCALSLVSCCRCCCCCYSCCCYY